MISVNFGVAESEFPAQNRYLIAVNESRLGQLRAKTMKRIAIASKSRQSRTVLIDEHDIASLASDHARMNGICSVLEVAGRNSPLTMEDRVDLARQLETSFDHRVRVFDSVFRRLFGHDLESVEDLLLAKLLKRQIHDALDAKDLSMALISGNDGACAAMLRDMLIAMRRAIRQTLHFEALALLVLLEERLTTRARSSLQRSLPFLL